MNKNFMDHLGPDQTWKDKVGIQVGYEYRFTWGI